jgi:hypothetical protein
MQIAGGGRDPPFRYRTSIDCTVSLVRNIAAESRGVQIGVCNSNRLAISVGDAERRNSGIRYDDRLARHPELGKRFGDLNSELFKAQMKPGDELWTFVLPIDSCQHSAGRAGLGPSAGRLRVATMTMIMN